MDQYSSNKCYFSVGIHFYVKADEYLLLYQNITKGYQSLYIIRKKWNDKNATLETLLPDYYKEWSRQESLKSVD